MGGVNLGYGGCVTAKVMEGKGTILPGAPKGSGPKKIFIDDVAMKVSKFILKCGKRDKELLKMYYLTEGYTVEEKSEMLKVPVKEIYRKLHRLQLNLVIQIGEVK